MSLDRLDEEVLRLACQLFRDGYHHHVRADNEESRVEVLGILRLEGKRRLRDQVNREVVLALARLLGEI